MRYIYYMEVHWSFVILFFLDRGRKMKNLRGLLLAFLILSFGIFEFAQAQDQQGTGFLL